KARYAGFQVADNVRFVNAGCGVNALSGLQSYKFMMLQKPCRPDKRSASGIKPAMRAFRLLTTCALLMLDTA
ncbi:hypothetical protein ACOQJS_24340, partial [Pseudocitrobacter faecalis]